ncbi:hypothetical protein KSF_111720 [Reticulibacter mediterranei]|uniref:DUF998 domain-containing protein n=1 Tax=Reticulibacter mediterranei TaxID=2778369 RepID=A0A8J3N7E5_9CHLR|nr:DUF998 domain-containing protein [Reticulibacter mediterranei]GHP01125.1 hypothetical protein KSF_111720 [Reticulibacter mediterranei]
MKGNKERTKLLLACGIIAGSIYIIAGGVQILTRSGFDMTRHPLSLMSLGDLGWIQITNFMVTGLLVIAAAVGLRSLAQSDKRQALGSLLVGFYGGCVVGGGIFVTDPALGFPPGAPDTYPQTMSWHAMLHFIVGQMAFLSLIAASFVFARHFIASHASGWAAFSTFTGVIFLAAIIALIATAGMAWASIFLYVAVALGWVWLSALTIRMRARV